MTTTRSSHRSRKAGARKRLVAIIVAAVVVVGGTGAGVAWTLFEEEIRSVLGLPAHNDYTGLGTAPEVTIVIAPGDFGDAVAQQLVDKGVTKSFDAVYDLLLADASLTFTPGTYVLNTAMSARAALDILTNPANRIVAGVTIPEGTVLPTALQLLSDETGIPLADFESAAADPQLYGVPAEAPSLEGYLFPATYEFDDGVTAQQVLQRLVSETFTRLDARGVEPADRHRVLTLAALIQREAGSNAADFPKVARVFLNRIEADWLLQSDATVAYGTGNLDTVWTTDAERADESNPYNTYVHAGLPIGPIGLPGEIAIDAALNPAAGEWFFFVPVNLKTGETVFSETTAQHDAAVAQLRAWCRASDENAAYCE